MRLWSDPRSLLQLDAVGAAVTSLLTGLVLAPGRLPTGLPPVALYVLAAVAAVFSLFGFVSLSRGPGFRSALRTLAIANVGYGVVTATLCAVHRQTLTAWGALYFGGEIAILCTLAWVEWRLTPGATAPPPHGPSCWRAGGSES